MNVVWTVGTQQAIPGGRWPLRANVVTALLLCSNVQQLVLCHRLPARILRASVRHANGTSLDVNSVFAISSASLATSVPCHPAVLQPLKGPKNAKPLWNWAIKRATLESASICHKATCA